MFTNTNFIDSVRYYQYKIYIHIEAITWYVLLFQIWQICNHNSAFRLYMCLISFCFSIINPCCFRKGFATLSINATIMEMQTQMIRHNTVTPMKICTTGTAVSSMIWIDALWQSPEAKKDQNGSMNRSECSK